MSQISVCICTYNRPTMLVRLLSELQKQRLPAGVGFSVVVADNDSKQSSRQVVEDFAQKTTLQVVYTCEPEQNIARARNRAIASSDGDYIAFIDDDEYPVPDWLALMLAVCSDRDAAGVLGPVRPDFDSPPPSWIIKGRFCERPEHPTGTVMPPDECRTGNVLFRREILPAGTEPFDPRFGSGGEDVDFFQRMNRLGHQFIWCNEAPAYETVPASRLTRKYIWNRALLRGRIRYKMESRNVRPILTSLIAVPAYAITLPFAAAFAYHRFVDRGMRMCDHLGRLLAMSHFGQPDRRHLHL
jgi:glycosyltransferase involved in cell wall biosynthesis